MTMRQQGKETDTLTYYEMFYSDFFQYMKRKKVYVPKRQRRSLGDAWNELLHEFVGQLVCDREKGSSVDSIFGELCSLYPHLFSDEIVNEDDELILVFETLRYTRKLRKGMRER